MVGHHHYHHRHHNTSNYNSNNNPSTSINNNSNTLNSNKKISWRYIWRTYLLDNNGQPLIDDNQLLINYGVVNKTILKFIKRCRYHQQHKNYRKK